MTEDRELLLAVTQEAEKYDEWQDCSCDDPDGGTCWYHLSDDEQMTDRVRYVSTVLDLGEDVIRDILVANR